MVDIHIYWLLWLRKLNISLVRIISLWINYLRLILRLKLLHHVWLIVVVCFYLVLLLLNLSLFFFKLFVSYIFRDNSILFVNLFLLISYDLFHHYWGMFGMLMTHLFLKLVESGRAMLTFKWSLLRVDSLMSF